LINKDDRIEWINLAGKGLSKYNTFGNLMISETGEITADLNIKRDGYFAFDRRQEINIDKEQVIKDFEKESSGFSVSEYNPVNTSNPDEILEEQFKGTITEIIASSGDMIYFNPCLYEKYNENPFKVEERNYPVDFAYPREYKTIYSFSLPAGWKVEEMPKNVSLKLENNGCRFQYNIQQVSDKIVFSQIFYIGQTVFLPADYNALKEFFKQIVAKQQEQIVLKKI